ncbi:hydantoinase/oxoprolinase family protein [Sneathiella limimaris]|uniref:hydantoinase/oxoprolinase family protein n=1 Tax=Sneathiella limimaris TaxID=1964213 RepID=UPI00146E4331|nr:hydantoinase/oxoprolinase family protein [Sneathiella limimaris]
MTGKLIGVDVGGTFTDLISVDPISGALEIAKVPTTVDNQAFGVLSALESAKVDLTTVAAINHGTTTTTNALLERKIAKVGLITTKGFRDVLELGRRTRPKPYGLKGSFSPLIPRKLRLEVAERMDADGNVVIPLDEEGFLDALTQLKDAGVESLVIHFLHSYKNSSHEQRALEIAKQHWHNNYITAGHQILSEYREYERGTTASINAAIQPVLDRYISRLQTELTSSGFQHDLLVMQGNGGSVAAPIVAESAVNTVMSGPASGVMAAAATARAAGVAGVITYDMGGTSSDVGIVQEGVPQVTSELDLEYGMPLHVPMVDVHTIGAGGGSIAWINEAGLLEVGPQSAGAMPGPICYGRGGALPTITDANLLLGRLDPDALLSVDGTVSRESLENIFKEKIGNRLGLTAIEVAEAIIRIANDKMAGAIRMVSLSRGHDPRDFALFAFGGAGPLHGGALARELGIPKLLLPVRPGITNALGCVVSDLRHDFVNTINKPLATLDQEEVRSVIQGQIEAGHEMIKRDNIPVSEINLIFTADMQFQGQSHMLPVSISGPEVTIEELQKRFDEVYWSRFGVELPEIRAVLVNVHTAIIGKREGISFHSLKSDEARSNLIDAQVGVRPVYFAGEWLETPIYSRNLLPEDLEFSGPAIINQLDTTIVIEPGWRVTADEIGNLVVEVTNDAN